MKEKSNVKGISLIVLVLTVIVLSILASAVIISISNTNILSEASKTVLKSNLTTMQDIATVYFAEHYSEIDIEKEYLITDFGITDDEFKDYRDYAVVKAGKVYIKPNAPENVQEAAEELNMLIDGTSSSTGEVALEKTVKALRIYGNTESEESVGEKTKNLFEVTSNTIVNPGAAYASNLVIEKAGFSAAIGSYTIDTSNIVSYKNGYVKLFVPAKEGTFTLSGKYEVINQGEVTDMSNISGKIGLTIGGAWYKNFTINLVNGNFTLVYTISDVEQDTTAYFNFPLCGNTVKYYDMQLEEGSAATDYEPYGYRIPVNVTGSDATGNTINKTYNIYLTEPLRKVGNVADYVDCTTGEVVRYIGVTEAGELQVLSTPIKESATLEEMNFEGVTHIVVDTTVIPSNLEVKY